MPSEKGLSETSRKLRLDQLHPHASSARSNKSHTTGQEKPSRQDRLAAPNICSFTHFTASDSHQDQQSEHHHVRHVYDRPFRVVTPTRPRSRHSFGPFHSKMPCGLTSASSVGFNQGRACRRHRDTYWSLAQEINVLQVAVKSGMSKSRQNGSSHGRWSCDDTLRHNGTVS